MKLEQFTILLDASRDRLHGLRQNGAADPEVRKAQSVHVDFICSNLDLYEEWRDDQIEFVSTAINSIFEIYRHDKVEVCLCCHEQLPAGCWADPDNDYIEKDCPIVKSKHKISSLNERNKLQGSKHREARIVHLTQIEKKINTHGPLSALELAAMTGIKKSTIWSWLREGVLQGVPPPKGYNGNPRARNLIGGINWNSDKKKIE